MTTTPRSRASKTTTSDDAPVDTTEADVTDAAETALDAIAVSVDGKDIPVTTKVAFPDVYPGSVGPLVEQVQAAVGVEVTGHYNKATKAAVQDAQRGAGLRPTGTFTHVEATAITAIGELLGAADEAPETS